jgi:PAS domain S-box-containing protein
MIAAPCPPDETRRLASLHALEILDTPPEPAFDRLAQIGRSMAGTPIAAISLSDRDRQWLKARAGVDITEAPRASSFCAHAILNGEVMWVEDARTDPRFADNPAVLGEPQVRFYAAAPIQLSDGSRVGAFCVIDRSPRPFDAGLSGRLAELAAQVADRLELRRDVKALKRAERSEERLRFALAIGNSVVWELCHDTRTFECSGAVDALFGRSLTYDSVSRDFHCTVHPEDLPEVAEAWSKHEAGLAPYACEYRVRREDGLVVWVSSTAEIVRGADGTPKRIVGLLRDITKKKQLELALAEAREYAERANQSKSEFLATISHEIRTPLNGVLGMAQALQAEELSPPQREKLKVIRRSGEVLLALLNDVLDLSKIEAGKLTLHEVEFDLEHLARGAMATFTALAAEKGVDFELTVGPEAKGVYRGDSTRVRQILYNLASNAVKFTARGHVRGTVTRADGVLIMEVADTGIGVPADKLPHLFQKFVQADGSTTRRFGGTGLGLAICRELTEMMGGEIEARSRVEEGSVFTVRLPLHRVADAKCTQSSAPAPTAPEIQRALKVLAAEDNDVNQLVLRTLLGPAGIEPSIVENGALAVAAWEAEEWDLILLDVQMPEMDGPTAARAIRERESQSGRRRTPILALTANAMTHQAESYERAGMDGVVAKPFHIGQLFDTIERVLAAEASGGSGREPSAPGAGANSAPKEKQRTGEVL